jgi:hypothetical protein
MPDRQDDLAPRCEFTTCETVEFVLRPSFGEEGRTKNHQAVPAGGDAFIDFSSETVAPVDAEFVVPDVDISPSQSVRQGLREGQLIF